MEDTLQRIPKRTCPYCAQEVSRRHLTTHIDRYHPDAVALAMRNANIRDSERRGESPSEPTALQRRHSATLSEVSDMTTSEGVSPTTPDTITPEQREAYTKAAMDLLDHHEIFHEEGLMKHLTERHPSIEPVHRFPLIIGATTGAQLAAKLHMLTQCAQYSSGETRRRKVADNAACALSYWNFGMRDGTQPTVPVFRGPGSFFEEEEETASVRAATQHRATLLRTKMLMPELAVPVSFEQANRDFAEELSDDELDEGPPRVNLLTNKEQLIVSSTSTPTTSAMMSIMSGGINSPYIPEVKKSVATTSTAAYNPTPLEQLPSVRTASTRRVQSDEESRQRSRSAGDEHAVRSTGRGVLSSTEATTSMARRASRTNTTAATATVTSAEAVEKIGEESRTDKIDYYRKKTVQRHMAYSRTDRSVKPYRGTSHPWRQRPRNQYMSREESDHLHHGQRRKWN